MLGGFSGGGDGGEEGLEATLTTERYDARSNTWTNGPNLVFFGHEGDVLTAAIGDDVFALEAHYVSGAAARLQRWRGDEIVRCASLSGNHHQLVDAPASAEPRTYSTNVLLADPKRNRLLAMDGLIDSDDAVTSSHVTIHAYDVELDAWSPLIHLEHPALGFTALRHGDRVFFPLRGEPQAGRETTAIGCLDLETDEWSRVGGSTALAIRGGAIILCACARVMLFVTLSPGLSRLLWRLMPLRRRSTPALRQNSRPNNI